MFQHKCYIFDNVCVDIPDYNTQFLDEILLYQGTHDEEWGHLETLQH